MPSPSRVHQAAQGVVAGFIVVAIIDQSAHAVNFSHPRELAATVEAWLDDKLGASALPDGVQVVRGARRRGG